jgi:sterol desaturase/sphingolipid hydroxylase (fatty acid hydroxylase superfamily)
MILTKLFPLAVVAATVLASLIEAFVPSRRSGYDWKAMTVSLFDLMGRTVLLVVLPISIATPVVRFAWEHRLTTQTLDSWPAFLLLFLGQEFCYYWYHRASHEVRWFWANHSVHHTPNQLNLSAAYRTGILGRLTGGLLFFVPLVWLGFSPQVVALTVALNLSYQFWLHATWIPKLGWLEYVFNTPSAHRVHHAANIEYLDSNYGGVLIVFDRLFRTYVEEQDHVPCRYGLVDPQTSYNPLRVELDRWIALARDVLTASNVKAAAGYLLMPPGWKPDGLSETTKAVRRRAGAKAGTAKHPEPNKHLDSPQSE